MAQPDGYVAVYEHRTPEQLRAALRDAGLHDDEFEVDTKVGDTAARRAEQHEEAERGFFAPHAGLVLPARSAKVTSLAIPAVAIVGAISMLVFAFVPMGERSVLERILWVAIIGAAMGGTIALIVAASMGADDPQAPSAADRGVAVRVARTDEATRDLLRVLGPVRLDLVHADGRIDKVVTEQDRRGGGALEELEDTVQREADAPPNERHY
jgi:hypothetical protein